MLLAYIYITTLVNIILIARFLRWAYKGLCKRIEIKDGELLHINVKRTWEGKDDS